MSTGRYTCNDYRAEMLLMGLRRRLHDPETSETEKRSLREEIRRLESAMQMD